MSPASLPPFISLCHCRVERKKSRIRRVKYWEIIADNLKKRGWSLGWVSALGSRGRTIWIVDAHRDEGKRFVVRAGEKLTAFVELESAIRARQEAGARNG
jgi:hypothetical protein